MVDRGLSADQRVFKVSTSLVFIAISGVQACFIAYIGYRSKKNEETTKSTKIHQDHAENIIARLEGQIESASLRLYKADSEIESLEAKLSDLKKKLTQQEILIIRLNEQVTKLGGQPQWGIK